MDHFTNLWIRFAREGNPKDYAEIYLAHFKIACMGAYKYLGNYPQAEDLTQDIFFRLFLNRERYQHVEHFQSWLHTIIRNDSLRTLKKELMLPFDEIAFIEAEEVEVKTVENYPIKHFREAISSLRGKNYKRILEMAFLEGKSNEEIAETIGKNDKYVRDRKVLAKKALKKKLFGN